jgi:hypothetical protein
MNSPRPNHDLDNQNPEEVDNNNHQAVDNKKKKKKKNNLYTVIKINNLIADLSPIPNILKEVKDDIVSTFQPYKSSYYSRAEWFQPFHGIVVTLYGVIKLAIDAISLPFVLVYNLLKDVFNSNSFPNFLTNVALTLVSRVAPMLADAAIILRGVTEIAATPLILAKKFLRNIISLFSDTPKIETLSPTVDLVKEGEEALHAPQPDNKKANNIAKRLHRLFVIEQERGVSTNVSPVVEANSYNQSVHQRNPSLYFNFFKEAAARNQLIQQKVVEQQHEDQEQVGFISHAPSPTN